jgi:hypothetical protein
MEQRISQLLTFKKQRKRTKNRKCVYRIKNTNIRKNVQIAIEKA